MLDSLNQKLLKDWDSYFPGIHKPRQIHYMGLPGSLQGETTSFMGFINPMIRPLFIVKVHRHQDAQVQVDNEEKILNHLHHSPNLIQKSIPRLILCEKFNHKWFVVQSIVPGSPLKIESNSQGHPHLEITKKHFELMIAWLKSYHDLTKNLSPWNEQKFIDIWTQKIDLLQKNYSFENKECQVLQNLINKLPNLAKNMQQWSFRHGDFCRQNILFDEHTHEMTIVDWTFAQDYSLPFHDLFFFLTTYFLQSMGSYGIESFTKAFKFTFFDSNPYSQLVHDTISDFFTAIQIDTMNLNDFFFLFLIEQTLFEYKQTLRSPHNGTLPRFNIFLASLKDIFEYEEVLKENIWIYFIKELIELNINTEHLSHR